MRKLLKIASILLFGVFMSLPAKAIAFQGDGQEIISSISIEEMETLLRPFGWQAEIFYEDGEKTDYILLEVDSISSFARLMDCTGEAFRRCRTVLFFANFDLGVRINPDYTSILNAFNDNNIVGRAYYLSHPDEAGDEVGLDLRISLHNGVTVDHLNHEVAQWKTALDDFLGLFNNNEE